jgi:integrase
VRAKRHARPPTALTQAEVGCVMAGLAGTHLLMAEILYGCVLRLMACVRLRVLDLDFDRRLLHVRQAKGGKDRTTVMPQAIQSELRLHLEKVQDLHAEDLKNGYGEVYLPAALARKYPSASREFRWQYVFPGRNLSCDPRSGAIRRHHELESGLQKDLSAVSSPLDRLLERGV